MSLDDLLTSAKEHRETTESGRAKFWLWVRVLAGCALVAFAAYQVLLAVGYRVPYPLLLAIGVVALLVRQIVTAAPLGALPQVASASPHGGATESVRPQEYRAVWRWISRLANAERDVDTFNTQFRPLVAELVEERLRLRHGIELQRDPHRARGVLPEELWRFVTGPSQRILKPSELSVLVEQIERL